MADLITMQQLTDRIGDLADEHTEATSLIADASWLVRDVIADDDLVDAWDPVPNSVVRVVATMVRRGLLNPDGFESETQQGYSYRGASTAGVYLTPREESTVRKAARRGSPRSIDLSTPLPIPPRNGLWL